MAAQLEAEGYPWVGCECCKGTVWVPFQMLRERDHPDAQRHEAPISWGQLMWWFG